LDFGLAILDCMLAIAHKEDEQNLGGLSDDIASQPLIPGENLQGLRKRLMMGY
jgi:hypothetical protein